MRKIEEVPGYETLLDVLARAYEQAAAGKGKERHANNLPFDEQPMQQIARRRGVGFLLGQADKKSEEAQGMLERGEVEAAIRELLVVIVYTAGAVIYIERKARHCTCSFSTLLTANASPTPDNDNHPRGTPCPGCQHPHECGEAGYCLERYRHG